VDSKAVYSKKAGNKKVGSEKISGFSVDFTLSLLLLSTKSYKKKTLVHFFEIILAIGTI